ncbi:hypothetical protein [Halopiger thermotolerans]
MTLDRHAAERRRFARLLGVDGELGSGLPIGDASRGADGRTERDRGADDGSGTGVDTESEVPEPAPSSGTDGST